MRIAKDSGARTLGLVIATGLALMSCSTSSSPAKYKIGVTVSGLVGSGLILQSSIGGGAPEELPIDADGAFSFPTKGGSGQTYSVVVKPAAHPTSPSQFCSVDGGSGTIGGADVSVTVTCVVGTHSIGGTVSELSGTGLVLTSTIHGDFPVTGNGAYTFPSLVATGAEYEVTVKTQPTGPSQTCSVSNGHGTVGDADVTDVNVQCVIIPYSVGGTVVGLVGSGLVLHSDVGQGEDLSVVADATGFTFINKALPGSTVTVTVKTQPASQTCTPASTQVSIGAADVTTIRITCSNATQRWEAPTTWGGVWSDSGTVQHAYFNGTTIVETKGVQWTDGSGIGQREFKGFPGASRWGAGPFTGPHFQATGGDSGFDFQTDMLACAVVKPDYNPVTDGSGEHVIFAKGNIAGSGSGWMLLQRHHMFNFFYHYDNGNSVQTANAYTPSYFADASLPGNGPLNPSFMVVCGGRNGDDIVVAANSFPDTGTFSPVTLPPSMTLYAGGTPHHLTIGGLDDDTSSYGGRIYETAIWEQAATPANIQAKFAAIYALPAGAQYTRNREGPFTGVDGQYHSLWRHAPRYYAANPTTGLNGGMLFGLQGWNRLAAAYTPPADDLIPQQNPVIAYGEALDLWNTTGGATVQKDQLVPPGDSEQNGAERVTLPPGASLSRTLGLFASAGPLHGMIWIQPVSTAGTLRIRTTQPASGASEQTVELQDLPTGRFTRVWLNGLSNDGSQTPADLFLENAGSAAIDFYAWGVDLTQIAGGGNLGTFDPGLEMYDWNGAGAPLLASQDDSYPIDVLQLPAPPSTGPGWCLAVEAQPPAGLDWTAPFVADRSPLTWISSTNSVNIFVSGTGNGAVPAGRLCAVVPGASSTVCWAPDFQPGSKHLISVCASPGGDVTLYADGLPVGTPATGAAALDLHTGHLLVGSNHPSKHDSLATWQGFVTRAAVCPFGNPVACQ